MTTTIGDLLRLVDDVDLLTELDRRGRHILRDLPAEVLFGELRRRNLAEPEEIQGASVVVGDLEVDHVGCVATWHGRAVRLTQRETQVLYALALARSQGVRWVRNDRLAVRIWRTADTHTIQNLRMNVTYLRAKLPGLIVTGRGSAYRRGAYGLALDDDAPAARVEAAV
jgi:DNA-binding response OmpR family regulator